MTGNYTYKNKALAETAAYSKAKNILTGSTFTHLEIFTKGKNETLSPSKWLTEIYFPIKPKVIAPVYKRVVRDSLAPPPAAKKQVDEFEF